MVQFIPPPDSRRLLPPLLACLPIAFCSARPPPALLPLLSPILRQRVQLLAANPTSPFESWLSLLCWDSARAGKLASAIEGDAFDQHPVSGEIEFEDVTDIKYRRLDEETLHAKLVIPGLALVVIYLWCQGDEEGGGNGWRVSEIMPVENQSDPPISNWYLSIPEAEEPFNEGVVAGAYSESSNFKPSVQDLLSSNGIEQDLADDKDDDYWAQYDLALAKSLKPEQPALTNGILSSSKQGRTTSDADYFARYSEVQPEMDNDDPSEDHKALGESSLNGNVLVQSSSQLPSNQDPNAPLFQKILSSQEKEKDEAKSKMKQPTASPPSRASFTVSRLEGSAATQSHYEVAIRQHISSSIKGLFDLTQSAGMNRVEFDVLVRTELANLSLVEEEDMTLP